MTDLSALVIKGFPESRNMQLVCLRIASRFTCSRCHRTKNAKFVAVVSGDWNRLLCKDCYGDALSEQPEDIAQDVLPKEWLGALVSVEDAEEQIRDLRASCTSQWEVFKAGMLEGDQLCEFTGPTDSSEQLAGSAGYALVRNGRVVKYIVTNDNGV